MGETAQAGRMTADNYNSRELPDPRLGDICPAAVLPPNRRGGAFYLHVRNAPRLRTSQASRGHGDPRPAPCARQKIQVRNSSFQSRQGARGRMHVGGEGVHRGPGRHSGQGRHRPTWSSKGLGTPGGGIPDPRLRDIRVLQQPVPTSMWVTTQHHLGTMADNIPLGVYAMPGRTQRKCAEKQAMLTRYAGWQLFNACGLGLTVSSMPAKAGFQAV